MSEIKYFYPNRTSGNNSNQDFFLNHPEPVSFTPLANLLDEEFLYFEYPDGGKVFSSQPARGLYPVQVAVMLDRIGEDGGVAEDFRDIRKLTHQAGYPVQRMGSAGVELTLFSLVRMETGFFPTYLGVIDRVQDGIKKVVHACRALHVKHEAEGAYFPHLKEAQELMKAHIQPWIEANPVLDQQPEITQFSPNHNRVNLPKYLFNAYTIDYLR